MKKIYQHIKNQQYGRALAVLIDPEKEKLSEMAAKLQQIHSTDTTHIFVGGSTNLLNNTDQVIREIKRHTALPVIIFPGDVDQITDAADAILFLSLISGRNPEYLIDKQVQAVPYLMDSALEVISTGYLLIESGSQSAVQRASNTVPLSRENIGAIVHTAKAGELLGMKLIYLEAGSGAQSPISEAIIKAVKNSLSVPLIVGGGIRNRTQLEAAYQAGADMVVVGTAFEQDPYFFKDTQHLNNVVQK
jgi:putative glycerol-1-phosphate prenyltransferase